MRKLIASTFVSLDGILQAPGGPEEDPTGGFRFGGWMFDYADDTMDLAAAGFDGKNRELVLGRRTYEIFAAYWPYQPKDDPIGVTFNATRKYVASRTLKSLDWHNATLLEGDVATALAALKQQSGPDLQIIGSGDLIQTLQGARLIDEFHVWTFPVVLGRGKRLFTTDAEPTALKLVRSVTSATGVVMSTYVPAGEIKPGTFAVIEPSEQEQARRKRWAKDLS